MTLSATPEFVDHKQARALFGLTRSHLYQLVDAGFIRSVSLRKPGKLKGRRLFVCQSIRDYLQSCIVAPANPTGSAAPSRTVAELEKLVHRLQTAAVAGEPLPVGLSLETARAALAEAKAAAGEPAAGEDTPAGTSAPENAADDEAPADEATDAAELDAVDTADGEDDNEDDSEEVFE